MAKKTKRRPTKKSEPVEITLRLDSETAKYVAILSEYSGQPPSAVVPVILALSVLQYKAAKEASHAVQR